MSTPSRIPHIFFFTPALRLGGSERSTVTLANYFARLNYKVTIVCAQAGGGDLYTVDPRLNVISLSSEKAAGATQFVKYFNDARKLQKILAKLNPDIIVAFPDKAYIAASLLAKRLKIPVVASERGVPKFLPLSLPWKILRRISLNRVEAVVAVSDAISHALPSRPAHQVRKVIPGPIEGPPIDMRLDLASKTIVSLGRPEHEKQFDLLIRAFHLITIGEKHWNLKIYGEGSQRDSLTSFITDLKLQDRVHLPGTLTDPYQGLREAAIFVSTSKFEGFPRAMAEAAMAGLPIVAFNSPGGIAEIVISNETGLLVQLGNLESLSQAIKYLMENPSLRRSMGEKGKLRALHFSMESSLCAWHELIMHIIQQHSRASYNS